MDREATKAGLTRVFDRIADDFDRSGIEFHRPAGRRLADYAELRRGETVLDVGCGRGAVTFPAATSVGDEGRVAAIDLSAAMVDHVTADGRRLGLANISAQVMDGESPDFPPGTFDVILGGFSIVMFLNAEDALRRYPPLLRSPGRLALSAPVFREDGMPSAFPPQAGDAFRRLFRKLLEAGMPRDFVDPQASWFGTPDGLASTVRRAGFRSVRMDAEPVRITMRTGWDWVRWTFAQGARLFWERISDAERLQLGDDVAAELETLRGTDGKITFPVPVRYVCATV
ncbi:class I SAM-dependent methyltransferase [Amycolatopsis silviterrae]|uniref:Class I SAM-dependent methyltransferase n=1 Tax=Amycolatopsis silviterrae TaxID=1656914 RepID=A0ABW5HGZ3_9PSEU